ncbi:Sin3 complex subunit [Coccidioides immitis RS]|uniref:Sin3 complex subunit n=1 Tax=Coccidioides immitis (strain RS) TaxID=246410 RepID=J3KEI3_COCIM|nr:Sin3 complex subunit [Coccidioides immitis RS]EAS33903.3 Sin3 complex subunit [Coccidioides immitis RS]
MIHRPPRLSYNMAQGVGSEPSSQRRTIPDQSASASPAEKSQLQAPAQSTGENQAVVLDEGYERLVFTDPVAFKCLEEDPSTVLVERRCTLIGYVTYIVEQWACSRVHPTFVINTYTGDPSHTAVAGVLKVPKDEQLWSPRLKVYFNTMAQPHTRKRETPWGLLMVTNLSSFPSSLTVIDIPEGDVRKYREDFVVNENLKRLGCSGRAGLNLKQPTPATEAKFYQLYRTSERVPLFNAVIGLVKLCQMALSVFDKLASEYIDGLLCDVTERAINDWWTDIGTELFNIEPSDGILGPTTVSALLGTLMGARNRLHTWGAPVSKDAFDIENLKRGIGSFQKALKLEKTRRLDRQTLDKLHRVTAKAASGEGWAVPRAVKSTVAELGGKGGEMVMGIVGGRDKAGISEVETLDIDRFVQLVSGERSKWLWHGKLRKSYTDPFRHDAGEDEMAFSREAWSSRRKDTCSPFTSARPSLETEQSWKHLETPVSADSKEQQLKYALKKTVSGRVSDARAGLGRFRDAVGLPALRSHQHHKQLKETIDTDTDVPDQQATDVALTFPGTKGRLEGVKSLGDEARVSGTTNLDKSRPELLSSPSDPVPTSEPGRGSTEFQSHLPQANEKSQGQLLTDYLTPEPRVSSGTLDELSHKKDPTYEPLILTRVLRRVPSCPSSLAEDPVSNFQARSVRHLSFSAVEEAMLSRHSIDDLEPADPESDNTIVDRILYEDMRIDDERALATKIVNLDMNTSAWVESQVVAAEGIDITAFNRLKELDSAYQNKYAEYQALQRSSTELVSTESQNLLEGSKRLETLGAKLDYELNSLQSKVEEVEGGLIDYEHQIGALESRLRELLKAEEQSGAPWLKWAKWFWNGGT